MIKNCAIATLLVLVLFLGYCLDSTQKQLRSVETEFGQVYQQMVTCGQAQAELQDRYRSVRAEYDRVFQRMVESSRAQSAPAAPGFSMPGGSILGGLAGRFLGLP